MTLRAKFQCLAVADYRPHHSFPNSKGYSEVVLTAQYSNSTEDNQFSEATPTGNLKMTVTTDTGKNFFVVGKSYFLDISEVES